MILIVSSPADVHAQAVLRALGPGRARILDLSDFPRRARLAVDPAAPGLGRLDLPDGPLELGAVGAVWWRRPQPYGLDPSLRQGPAREFALHECHEAIQGLWLALDAGWINDPARDEAASRKLWQLRLARECGLETPRTLIANDPAAARAFVEAAGPGRTVYKAFQGSEAAWRETRLLRAAELDRLEAVRHAPVIFQDYVVGLDLRVTVVGEEMFAAAISPPEGGYEVDIRMGLDAARIDPAELPAEIAAGLARLMRRLGLVYGAVDLRRTPEGRHVFLEVNPAGQWLFVEDRTGQRISAALAARLVEAEAARR